MPGDYKDGEELHLGRCFNCGYEESRPAEELEPNSPCPNCRFRTFGYAKPSI